MPSPLPPSLHLIIWNHEEDDVLEYNMFYVKGTVLKKCGEQEEQCYRQTEYLNLNIFKNTIS